MAIGGKFKAASPATSRRSAARRKLQLELQGNTGKGGPATVTLHNLSSTGVLLGTPEPLHLGERLRLVFPGNQAVGAKVVWAGGELFGCKFDRPISQALISAARLKSRIDEPGDAPVPSAAADAATQETLGKRVRQLRKARGITQIGMARQLGVSKPTVWKWERDEVRPRPATLAKLADALGVTPSQLVFGAEHTVAKRAEPSALRTIIAGAKAQVAELFGLRPDLVEVTVTIRE